MKCMAQGAGVGIEQHYANGGEESLRGVRGSRLAERQEEDSGAGEELCRSNALLLAVC